MSVIIEEIKKIRMLVSMKCNECAKKGRGYIKYLVCYLFEELLCLMACLVSVSVRPILLQQIIFILYKCDSRKGSYLGLQLMC
jgi:hypothetical protein